MTSKTILIQVRMPEQLVRIVYTLQIKESTRVGLM